MELVGGAHAVESAEALRRGALCRDLYVLVLVDSDQPVRDRVVGETRRPQIAWVHARDALKPLLTPMARGVRHVEQPRLMDDARVAVDQQVQMAAPVERRGVDAVAGAPARDGAERAEAARARSAEAIARLTVGAGVPQRGECSGVRGEQ